MTLMLTALSLMTVISTTLSLIGLTIVEQCAKNNYLNTNIYSSLETSGGQSSNLYLNVVHFFNTSVN